MFAAIFWDNDGVLMETEHLYFEANAEALARVGFALTPETFAEVSLRRGESVLQLAALAEPAATELRRWRDQRYQSLLAATAPVMPGALVVLRHLHGRQPMAVVTNCRRPHFELMHQNSGLLGYFDFILTREDYGQGKPDPEPYLTACARVGVAAADCLAIEDSERGVTAAHRAGLTVAALPGTLNAGGDFRGARWRLEHLEQLPALLAGISPPLTRSPTMDDLFARLAAATERQNRDGELPDFIAPLLLKVAAEPQRFAGQEALVAELLRAVEEYQTYSFTCCEKIGYGLEDIHRLLDKLRVSY